MARPKKQIVDYFSHDCEHGKTLFVLEAQFGNDGYAFWFKLLECLGKTEGHCYNYKEPSSRMFLLSKTRVNEDTANNILSLLADMGAIDQELWQEGMIWSQNFVDRLEDVYTRRKVEKPLKPTLTPVEQDKCQQKPQSSGDMENINPQIKVNKIKVNNPLLPPPKIEFKNNRFENIPNALMEKWREVAPGINIDDEIKKSELWLLAHPQKRRSRYNVFLSNWMVKAQDNFIKYGGASEKSGNTTTGYKKPISQIRGNFRSEQRGLDPKIEAETDAITREYYANLAAINDTSAKAG